MKDNKWTATIYDCPYCRVSYHFNSDSYESEKMAIRKTMLKTQNHFKRCPDYKPGKIKTTINLSSQDSTFGYSSYEFLQDTIIL